MKGQRACILWFSGLSGSGKSTIADAVERALNSRGHHTMMLDGDNLRQGLNRDLSFSEEDRVENIRRAAEVGKLFCNAGLITLCCFITPYRNDRLMVRDIVGSDNYIEVFVDTPVEECIRRDPKGLYAKAISGAITNFTGISAPYEAPENPGIRIGTLEHTPEEAVRIILQYLAGFQEGQISAP
jgi:bifunctional enzyme CysN/CysC